MEKNILRPHAESAYKHELEALKKADDKPKPHHWQLSPWAVLTYIMGGKIDKIDIEPKYFGDKRLIETAIATLATDRALLLIGVPGTAKTWVSENLAAAISGDSKLLVQGTAGIHEEALRYGWNYAQLIAKGPSREALVPSPVMTAMQLGKIARVEELTRIPADVQDALITLLSEKSLPVPELNDEIQAQRGFNLIATANTRDKGVNELSSALRRRFNSVLLPLPSSLEEEVNIVQNRVAALGTALELPTDAAPIKEITRLVTIFRELRQGQTEDGQQKLKSPSATLSTAEAISVVHQGQALAVHFGKGIMTAADLAPSLKGAIVRDTQHDDTIWKEYVETVMKRRQDWGDLYEVCK